MTFSDPYAIIISVPIQKLTAHLQPSEPLALCAN